jgi:hypothetical protein
MAYTLVPTELIVDGAITSAKLDTNIAISGTLGVTGVVTLATHLVMGDNDKIKIGTGGDLEIYHDGSNSYISNSTGNIYLGDTNGSVHIQAKLNEESIVCASDGAVTLYHDNSPKLATSSAGVTVTGTLAATLSTASQPNITSVGTLTGLTSSGAITAPVGTAIGQATFSSNIIQSNNTGNAGARIRLAVSSEGNPTYSFEDDTNTGMFTSGADTLNFTTGGTNRMTINSTGIDVTGTATMDGLTVDGNARIEELGAIAKLTLERGGSQNNTDSAAVDLIETNAGSEGANFGDAATNGFRLKLDGSANDFLIQSGASGTVRTRLGIDRDTGDISFYEDTGSTAKFFWDASAESLGIGTDNPSTLLHLSAANDPIITLTDTGFGASADITGSNGNLRLNSQTATIFDMADSEVARINSSGNVEIGTSNPSGNKSIIIQAGTDSSASLRLKNDAQDWDINCQTNDTFAIYNQTNSSQPFSILPNGNVGIGNSSPSPLYWPNGSTGGLFLQAGALLSAYNAGTNLSQNYYYNSGEKFIGNGGASRYVQSGQEHIWSHSTAVNSSGAGAGLTWSESMRITSAGLVAINTTTVASESALNIGAVASAGAQEGGHLVLQSATNGSKAIHIDNYNNASTDFCRFMSGTDTNSASVIGAWDITNTRFGIGTATPAQTLTVAGSAWAQGYYITALQGNSQLTNASTSSGSNASYIGQGLISVTVSDAKSKENFGSVETNECLNKIVSLAGHVKKFDWIDEDWKKEKGRTVGMVAQEIYEDHSEFVHKPENYDDDGWAIRYQEIVPTLTKAIQEQQTIIDDLKTRIETLEG